MSLSGLIAAPHTPFHADGRVNPEAIGRLADLLITNGIDGVFVCGTTGEGLSLTRSEREAVVMEWVRAVGRRTPVVVHVGCAGEAEAVTLARHAADAGADAIAAVAPFYHRPAGGIELVQSFRMIAAAAPRTPFYFYDIPSTTGVSVPTAEVMARATDEIPTFAGVKFSNPDLVLLQECLTTGDSLDVLFGVDEMLLAALALGVSGAVGSTYNFALPLYRRLIAAFKTGDLPTARRLQRRSVELVRVLDRFGGLAAGKAVLSFLGIDCGPVRGPLRSLDRDELAALRNQLDAIGFFSADFASRPSS
jgi:N-acetylneuraminate lyase